MTQQDQVIEFEDAIRPGLLPVAACYNNTHDLFTGAPFDNHDDPGFVRAYSWATYWALGLLGAENARRFIDA